MYNFKNNAGMESRYVEFTRHYDTPDEIAAKSLSEFTVSSTVTHGPNASALKKLLKSINKACLANQPETVAKLTKFILDRRLTEYMDISKMEIILAHTRAVTLMDPEVSVKDFYESLLHEHYNYYIIN